MLGIAVVVAFLSVNQIVPVTAHAVHKHQNKISVLMKICDPPPP